MPLDEDTVRKLEQQNEALRNIQIELEASRDLYMSIHEAAPIGYVIVGADLTIHQFNQKVSELLKRQRGEILGTALRDHVLASDHHKFDGFVASLKEEAQAEMVLRMHSGDSAIFAKLQAPIGTPNGNSEFVIAVTDVTDIQRKGREAERERLFFEAALDTVHEGLLVLNKDFTIELANETFCQNFGYDEADLLGSLFFTIGEGTWEALRVLLNQLLETGQPVRQHELYIEFPELGARNMMANAHSFHVPEDQVYVLVALHDVTHFREIERQKRQSQENLAMALKGSQIVLFTQDADLCYTWLYNARDTQFTQQAIGQRDRDVLAHPEEAQRLEAFKQQVIDSGLSAREIHQVTLNEERRYFDILVDPVMDADGNVLGIRGAAVDITESQLNAERTAMLQQLATQLSQAYSLDEVIDTINRYAGQIIDAYYIAVALFDDTGQALDFYAAESVHSLVKQAFRKIPLDYRSPITDAIRTGKVTWVQRRAEYLQLYPELAAVGASTSVLTESSIGLPLQVKGETLGAIGVSYVRPQIQSMQNVEFFKALAAQCALAINRAQLQEKAQEHAVVQERHRLARELHDAVSQSIFSARVIAESITSQLSEESNAQTTHYFDELQNAIRMAQAEMRMMLLELRPDRILRGNFDEQLGELVETFRNLRRYTINFHSEMNFALPSPTKLALYRIAQEALNNITKHAQAMEVTVSLKASPEGYTLEICDDGVGFDTEKQYSGMGLTSIQERVTELGAEMSIASELGDGTCIKVRGTPFRSLS